MSTNKEPKPAKVKKPKKVKEQKPKTSEAKKIKGAPKSSAPVNSVKIFKPTLPSVNMRPNTISLKYKKVDLFKKVILSIVGVLLLFIGVAGGNIALGFFQEAENNQVAGEIEQLQEESGDVEPYKVYIDGIETLRSNMSRVMSQDLDMGVILNAVNSAANDNNVLVTSLKTNETLSGIEPNGCANSSATAATAPQAGCIIISGSASSRDDALTFFETLEANEGIDSGFISKIGSSGTSITFSGTAVVRTTLFSKRNTFLTSEIGETLRNGGLQNEEEFLPYTSGVGGAIDPQFITCEEANNAGYGPYVAGVDPEYQFYAATEDPDNTGTVCTPPDIPEGDPETVETQNDAGAEDENVEVEVQ